MSERNVPEIRFQGFCGEWEQRIFEKDIVSVQTGTNKLGNGLNKGTPLLKMGNIQRGYFDLTKIEYLAESEVIEQENIAYYGDFFFNTRNTLELVGKGATWTGEGFKYAFNNNIARFFFRDTNTIFFNYLYNTKKLINQVHARAMGTTSVAAIYPSSLNSIVYYMPKENEQAKIGEFFKNLDNLIAQNQKKYDKLVSMKKACLDKMFPKDGADTPEVRFQGFNGDWESKEVHKMVDEIATGKSKFISNIAKTDLTPFPILGSTSIIGYSDTFDYSGDFILTARVGANAGDLYRYTGSVKISDNTVFINGKNTNYLFYSLISKGLKQLVFGTGQPLIKASELNCLLIPFPIDEIEQTKIGTFFQTIDHLITLRKTELEKLKNIKKACLDKMFI